MVDTPRCEDLFAAVSNPVRRRVLVYLDRVGVATLFALSTRVDVDVTTLHHAHLPVLADANCVRCTDSALLEHRVVSITRVGATAVDVLDAIPEHYDC